MGNFSLGSGANRQHLFRVTVSKGARTAVAELALTPVVVPVLSGRLARSCPADKCGPKHNPSLPLFVSLIQPQGQSGVTVAWTVNPSVAISSQNGNGIVVPPSALASLSVPVLTVKATLTAAGANAGDVSLDVPINSPPFCQAQAQSGAQTAAACVTSERLSATNYYPGA
mgnify:CR=1 FL=1